MTDPARANPAVPKTILIVEDNSLNMKLFSDVLTSRGYRVIGTSSGLAAKQMAADSLPDLILMDIQLSEVSGYDVIEAIKADEQTRAIPIIAVTAYAMREDERRVRSMGCASYISKPIFIGPFVREIETVLAGDQGVVDDEADPEEVDLDPGFFRRSSDISVSQVPLDPRPAHAEDSWAEDEFDPEYVETEHTDVDLNPEDVETEHADVDPNPEDVETEYTDVDAMNAEHARAERSAPSPMDEEEPTPAEDAGVAVAASADTEAASL